MSNITKPIASLAVFAVFACSGATTQEAPPEPPQNPDATKSPEVLAPAGNYRIDRSHSSIVWRVNHLGLANYTARFNDFQADLLIDPASPDAAQLTVSIDPMSVDTAYPYTDRKDFDAEVATDERLLNAEAHASIDFISTSIEQTSPTTALIRGDLTLLGVTNPIEIKATYNGSLEAHPFSKRPMLGFSGTTTVKRSEFGMTYLLGQIGDDVEVALEMEFSTDAPS